MSAGKDVLLKRLKSALFLLGVGLASLWLAGEGIRIALAARLGDSSSILEMKRAVSLDQRDPGLHFRLGRAEIYGLEDSDPSEGIRQLQRATELAPHVTRYWMALAFACEFENTMACANHAIARSVALSPMVPQVRWEAASYYLRANRPALAFSQFRRLLQIAPSYAGAAFEACLQAADSPEAVYRQVVGPSSGPSLKMAYVNFLSTHGQEKVAFEVWKEVAGGKTSFSFPLVDPYLKRLIDSRHYRQASVVWHDLERRGIVKQSAGHDPDNLVFNGGFEESPLDAGFDWRYRQEPYVAIDFRARHAYQGKRCLEIVFSDVENHRDEPVYQLVPVEPGKTYELSAYVRSNNITSDSGPRLRLVDPECPACLNVSTRATLGTTPWHKVSLNFRTGPHAHLVRLSVWRSPGIDFPAEILGTLWLDQVSIREVPSPSDKTSLGRRA